MKTGTVMKNLSRRMFAKMGIAAASACVTEVAIAAKGDNGSIALGPRGKLLGVPRAFGQHQVKLGCACSHVQKALQALGNFARRTRLGGGVGDDERATKISCVHGATPGV